MKLISKKQEAAQPVVFRNWVAENIKEIEHIENDARSSSALWDMLGKTLSVRETQIDPTEVRYELQLSLYQEQGGICCYCGNRLRRERNTATNQWEFLNQSIEHFKSKSKHKALIFNYENLMLCCKSSSHIARYRVGDRYGQIEIHGWEDVATLSELPIEKILNHTANRNLKKQDTLKDGDVIHVPNPPHCDDEKSKFDEKELDLRIINPTLDGHLIDRLIYIPDGNISYESVAPEETAIIEKTIKVLNLRVEKLSEKRKSVWGKTDRRAFEEKYAESLDAINNADISNEERKSIIRKLIEKSLEPDERDGLLAPFCFVEYASLKSQFSSIFV